MRSSLYRRGLNNDNSDTEPLLPAIPASGLSRVVNHDYEEINTIQVIILASN